MCLPVEAEAEADVLEEDVFPEEAVSCLLSPLHSDSVDFPESPVSLHAFTSHITIPFWSNIQNTSYYLLKDVNYHGNCD